MYYQNLFQKLPFFDAIRVAIVTIVRRYIFKFAKLNYSQTGEEYIINHLIGGTHKGFYVDVGCHHPYKISNTFSLYLKGWTGINIDANERLISKFKKARKSDTSIFAAISDVEEETTFYKFKESEASSLSKETFEAWQHKFNYESSTTLKTKTLTHILDEHLLPGQKIDLLTIDVEGLDFKVLKSLDLDKYQPKLILVEIHDNDLSTIGNSEIYKYLNSYSYHLVAFATMNAYFMKH